MRRAALTLALALLLAATGAACGGGGGGSSPTEPGPTTPPPTNGLSFTAAGSPSGASLFLSRSNEGNEILELALEARSLGGVYGVYFDLTYPAGVLSFDSATEGSLLSAGGTPTTFQVSDQGGRLVVAVSRLGQVGGAGGSGTVVTLRFRATADGNGQLTFSNNAAETQDNRTLDAQWIGGSVAANL